MVRSQISVGLSCCQTHYLWWLPSLDVPVPPWLSELIYFIVVFPCISSLQVSSTCLLIALSTADFHFNLDGGFSMSSKGGGRSYRLSNSRIRLSQELSVGAFMASCRRHISLSIPSLVSHLQKRPSMFLCMFSQPAEYQAGLGMQTTVLYLVDAAPVSFISFGIASVGCSRRLSRKNTFDILHFHR